MKRKGYFVLDRNHLGNARVLILINCFESSQLVALTEDVWTGRRQKLLQRDESFRFRFPPDLKSIIELRVFITPQSFETAFILVDPKGREEFRALKAWFLLGSRIRDVQLRNQIESRIELN